jgi:GNAT superfamily N-acetyltransferase
VTAGQPQSDDAARARAWVHAAHDAVCDVVEPWAHGTVVRASRYPTYYDYNLVRVENRAELSVEGLVGVADETLAGLTHRHVMFEVAAAGEPLCAGFESLGWKVTRLIWMLHAGGAPPGDPALRVEPVPYEAVHELRVGWLAEEFPDLDVTDFLEDARDLAIRRGAEVLSVVEDGEPVGFAQLERVGDGAEITDVFVRADRRGEGLGTAITQAAITAVGEVGELWILADADDRAKDLYARLGFRPVWTVLDFLRPPAH